MQWVSFALHMTESSSMGIRLWSVGAEITNLYGAQGKPSVVVLEKRRKLNRKGGFDTRDLILNRLAFRRHRPHRLPHRWLHRSALSFEPIYERAGVNHGKQSLYFGCTHFSTTFHHHRNHLPPPLPTLLNGRLRDVGSKLVARGTKPKSRVVVLGGLRTVLSYIYISSITDTAR